MESRGKKEGRQGTEEEGKAEEEGTPPRGRRARERHQRRRDLWYDEGYQTKTSKPKKGRHEILYHTARARNVPDLRAAADAGIGLERDNQGGVQGHAPPVRREARAEVRDLEARIPARRHWGGSPGPARFYFSFFWASAIARQTARKVIVDALSAQKSAQVL